MTGHEIQRLDFAAAVLELIIKDPPKRKEMAEFIKSYARDNGMLPKVCYSILKALKEQTIVRYDYRLGILGPKSTESFQSRYAQYSSGSIILSIEMI